MPAKWSRQLCATEPTGGRDQYRICNGRGKLSCINVLSEGHPERSTVQITWKTELERASQDERGCRFGSATAEIMANWYTPRMKQIMKVKRLEDSPPPIPTHTLLSPIEERSLWMKLQRKYDGKAKLGKKKNKMEAEKMPNEIRMAQQNTPTAGSILLSLLLHSRHLFLFGSD